MVSADKETSSGNQKNNIQYARLTEMIRNSAADIDGNHETHETDFSVGSQLSRWRGTGFQNYRG